MPCLLASSRKSSRKPGCGSSRPALPITGSTMIPASRAAFFSMRRRTSSGWLKGSTSMLSATEGARPDVATEDGASSGPDVSGSGATLTIAKSLSP